MAGTVIGSLMLLVGIFALGHVVKITIDERSAEAWEPHLAQVSSAALKTHENEKGEKRYAIDVSYDFEWEGGSFKGTRYRLHDRANPTLRPIVKSSKSFYCLNKTASHIQFL